jgi:hypothetical protein
MSWLRSWKRRLLFKGFVGVRVERMDGFGVRRKLVANRSEVSVRFLAYGRKYFRCEDGRLGRGDRYLAKNAQEYL